MLSVVLSRDSCLLRLNSYDVGNQPNTIDCDSPTVCLFPRQFPSAVTYSSLFQLNPDIKKMKLCPLYSMALRGHKIWRTIKRTTHEEDTSDWIMSDGCGLVRCQIWQTTKSSTNAQIIPLNFTTRQNVIWYFAKFVAAQLCLLFLLSTCTWVIINVRRHSLVTERDACCVSYLRVCNSINEVNQRRARLVLRWVTVSGFNSRRGTFISACNQPPRSTQPGHPFVGRRNEYQRKGGDASRLGSKARYGSCVGGR